MNSAAWKQRIVSAQVDTQAPPTASTAKVQKPADTQALVMAMAHTPHSPIRLTLKLIVSVE
eukprot:jgi/Hompol1/1764/HPOL_005708-RA